MIDPQIRPDPETSADAVRAPGVLPRRTPVTTRAIDLVVATTMVVVLSPLMALVALAVRLESRGPAIYRGARLGRGREPFTVYKYRSMQHQASDDAHRRYVLELLSDGGGDDVDPDRTVADRTVAFKLEGDPRVTRVGRFIRRTTLDELPQLFNVIRGDMSLVGPRPEVPYALEAYEPWHHERFAVRPGLTGLWQVSGRGDLSPRDMLALDVEYARRRSIALDLRILLRTIPAVLAARGAS